MNDKYWIALSSIEQLDSVFIQKLYNYFGDIEAAFNAPEKEYANIEGLSIKKTDSFLTMRKDINPEKLLEDVEKRGINFITFDNPKYPYMLSQIYNPPMVIYYKGDLFGCNLMRTVAFVGSRRASVNGKDSVKKIIDDLHDTDVCIISGLAEGIDATAHRCAIDNGLKTIGVIASGFDFKYPATNRDLYEKLEHGCGAVITEYFPNFEPVKFRFPQRNRIVTGLSYGTVVGEAAIKSGALISANLTLEQGRELMCVPGSINNKNTEGVYKLLKNGATMVTCGEDVLNALNWEIKKNTNNVQSNIELNSKYLPIFNLISIEPKNFDELQIQTGYETSELLKILTMMELEGYIIRTDADIYKKV